MEQAGTILLVVGFLCAFPMALSVTKKGWRFDMEGRVEGPRIENIERKTWAIRLFVLGACLFVAGAVLLLVGRS